ncbi:20766_t:CDS:1, partial [Rhizophagus irregularis]
MSNLNKDILYLIFEELQDDDNTLYSCLLVNKTWCETIVPTLWKDPWKRLKNGKERSLLNVIISHLSKESRNNLGQHFDFLIDSYQNSIFDYISFCRHLNLNEIQRIIDVEL